MTAPAPLAESLVEKYHSMTVPQLYQAVGDETIRRWESLGHAEGKIHWAYGGEAESLIAEGFPAMVVYKAISIKAGVLSQVIRKAYYTYKAFDAEVRTKYEVCPYSVFQHARTQKDPIKVLDHYLKHRTSVDEIVTVFPIIENEDLEKEFKSKGYSRIFYGVYREVYACDPFLKARADELIQELEEIIKQVNK